MLQDIIQKYKTRVENINKTLVFCSMKEAMSSGLLNELDLLTEVIKDLESLQDK